MHNMPDLAAGRFAIRPGPMMASYDVFEIAINGKGSHAAMPHQGVDPVVVAANVVTSLQSIVSRTVNPVDAVVVSVTQIHGGDAWNVIPDDVVLRGTCRCFRPEVQQGLEASIRRIAEGVCAAFGARMTMRYEIRYPALVNDGDATERAARIAEDIVGPPNVSRERQPTMGSEDFAFMLQAKKGAYIFIGNGKGGVDSCMLHNPYYDFNDDILPLGASYWARMVELSLPKS
jgi:hippurate hydrolase